MGLTSFLPNEDGVRSCLILGRTKQKQGTEINIDMQFVCVDVVVLLNSPLSPSRSC